MITLYALFPKKIKKTIIIFSAALSSILFILVNYFIIMAIYDEITLFHAISGALNIPVWVYYAGVPLFSIFVFRGIVRDANLKLAELNNKDKT